MASGSSAVSSRAASMNAFRRKVSASGSQKARMNAAGPPTAENKRAPRSPHCWRTLSARYVVPPVGPNSSHARTALYSRPMAERHANGAANRAARRTRAGVGHQSPAASAAHAWRNCWSSSSGCSSRQWPPRGAASTALLGRAASRWSATANPSRSVSIGPLRQTLGHDEIVPFGQPVLAAGDPLPPVPCEHRRAKLGIAGPEPFGQPVAESIGVFKLVVDGLQGRDEGTYRRATSTGFPGVNGLRTPRRGGNSTRPPLAGSLYLRTQRLKTQRLKTQDSGA